MRCHKVVFKEKIIALNIRYKRETEKSHERSNEENEAQGGELTCSSSHLVTVRVEIYSSYI